MTFNLLLRLPGILRSLACAILISTFPVALSAQIIGSSLADRSIEELKTLAEDGDLEATLLVGDAYLKGGKVPKDPAEGVRWIRRAADKGVASAYYILGICYDVGQGVERDMTQAVAWYRKGAESGVIDAQYNLADCYLRGDGVERNITESVKWFERAAEGGDTAAVAQLGFLYLGKDGGDRDPEKAATYLRKAAYGGNNAAAKWALGTLYQMGEGVAQNDEDAVRWFKESAVQGDSTGMYHLALVMAEGRGTPKDELRANEWMQKAAAKGNPMAREHLEKMASAKTAGTPRPAEPVLAETPAAPPASKPSFVSAAVPEERESFASFVATPPGSEPSPRETDGKSGFSSAPAAPQESTGGFTSFIKTTDTSPKPSAEPETTTSAADSVAEIARKAAAAAMASVSGAVASEEPTVATEPSFASKSDPGPPAADTEASPLPDSAPAPPFASSKSAPEKTVEPQIVYRDNGGAAAAFPVAIAYMTLAMASAMVIISLLFFLTFKTRIRSLEGEIKKAQFELSKANVNLSSMMHQVEQLALKAPDDDDEGMHGMTSLPEWDAVKSQAAAETFKISRAR
jgi:TPR repeat protein